MNLDTIIQHRPLTFRPSNSEQMKQSKTNCLWMFFEIGNLKHSAIFTGKHMCWGLFLIKSQVFRTPPMAASYSPPQYSKVSWDGCSLISLLHVLSVLIRNFHKTLHKSFFTITQQNTFFRAWIHFTMFF